MSDEPERLVVVDCWHNLIAKGRERQANGMLEAMKMHHEEATRQLAWKRYNRWWRRLSRWFWRKWYCKW